MNERLLRTFIGCENLPNSMKSNQNLGKKQSQRFCIKRDTASIEECDKFISYTP